MKSIYKRKDLPYVSLNSSTSSLGGGASGKEFDDLFDNVENLCR